MVVSHIIARVALSKVFVVSIERIVSPMWTNSGMDNTTTQATASKQLDIFFILGDILLFLLFFLTTRNSL
jgi:hypothetical protein